MKDHEGCHRAFHQLTPRYEGLIDSDEMEIVFGMYLPDGCTSGSMAMIWKMLSNHQVPRLEVFDDAWSALHLFADIIEKLAEKDGENITPEQFTEILLSCGFVDITAYEK